MSRYHLPNTILRYFSVTKTLERKIGFRYGKLCRESAAFQKSAANWRANRSSNRAMNTACSTSCCAARLDTITWNLFSSSGMAGLPNCLIHHGSDFIHRVVRCTVYAVFLNSKQFLAQL